MSIFVSMIVYFVFALMVGLCAIDRKPGFVVTFLLSWLITPFVMLLLLYLTRPRVQLAEKH